jgi:hypothetical protein
VAAEAATGNAAREAGGKAATKKATSRLKLGAVAPRTSNTTTATEEETETGETSAAEEEAGAEEEEEDVEMNAAAGETTPGVVPMGRVRSRGAEEELTNATGRGTATGRRTSVVGSVTGQVGSLLYRGLTGSWAFGSVVLGEVCALLFYQKHVGLTK